MLEKGSHPEVDSRRVPDLKRLHSVYQVLRAARGIEVGHIFKVTRERIRQIEAKAVRKLQQPYRCRGLMGFLEGLEVPRAFENGLR